MATQAQTAPDRSNRSDQRTPQRLPVRRRMSQQLTDRYYIDPSWVPPGQTWEWKRADYMGVEDVEHIANLQEYGAWDYVSPQGAPAALVGRLPNPKLKVIKRGNLVLMQRPTELTEEARAEDKEIALDQVQTQAARLGLKRSGRSKKVTPGLAAPKGLSRETAASELQVPESETHGDPEEDDDE